MVDNAAAVVGIELLAAAQGIDFHGPARSSALLEKVHARIRGEVSQYAADRYFAPTSMRPKAGSDPGRFAPQLGEILPSYRP